MDIILTAIVIGFLFSVGLAFISGFVKAWKTLQQQSDDKPRTMIKDGKEYTVDPAAPMILVTIEKVTQKNCSVLLMTVYRGDFYVKARPKTKSLVSCVIDSADSTSSSSTKMILIPNL